jgi:CBS domain-containing protein
VGADRALKRLGLIRVDQLMDPELLPSVRIRDSVDTAKREIERYGVRSAFVVDEDGVLKGWVDTDGIRQSPKSLLEAMVEADYHEVGVRKSNTAREALSAMVARGFRITPVVDAQGKLLGSITLKALQELSEQGWGSEVEEAETS